MTASCLRHLLDSGHGPAGLAIVLLVVLLGTQLAIAQDPPERRKANYDESQVPAYTLPDPLVDSAGQAVTDAAAWVSKRRPELLEIYQREVYGRIPPAPQALRVVTIEEDPQALGGKATRLQLRLLFDGSDAGPGADLLVYLPNGQPGPVPAIAGLNFGGNHTVHDDPAIRIPTSWIPGGGGPASNKPLEAREADRGKQESRWPIETIVGRGYAIATAYYGDIDPDYHDGFTNGVHPLFVAAGQDPAAGDFTGTIGAWAWGLSRLVDALSGRPEIDPKRIAVVGHSRLGKTALWAGAQDERIALVVSNNSGEGGAALARRCFGETVAIINDAFPHWFCTNFKKYNDREPELPVDQHELIALCAPRPVLVLSAQADAWADPRGEFLAALGADPVYRLLGTEGLPATEWPDVNTPVFGTLGYHIRPGEHDLTEADWNVILDFADRHLATIPKEPAQ